MLEVQSIEHVFPKIRVDINEENQIQATYTGLGIDWNQRGYSVVYPLEIQAKAEAEYFMVNSNQCSLISKLLTWVGFFFLATSRIQHYGHVQEPNDAHDGL